MDVVLSGLQWHICLAFLDDVMIYASTFELHCQRLELVFDRLRKANLKLKPGNCKLFCFKTRFLGSIVSEKGIEVDPEKVSAVVNWPRPINVTEVRAFTALAGYYRRHIKRFAEIARPLHELTREAQPFIWSERQQAAFEKLKQCLVSAEVLAAPTEEGRYILDRRFRKSFGGSSLATTEEWTKSNSLRKSSFTSGRCFIL